MSHFDDPANVEAYAALTADAVDETLYAPLHGLLERGARVLELGSGPGHDLVRLAETFEVTGSDTSNAFVDYVSRVFPEFEMLRLDARTLDTDRRFDAIFSNKVLQYLDDKELRASFNQQANRLAPGGVAFHTFWRGQGTEPEFELTTFRRRLADVKALLGAQWAVVEHRIYSELLEKDSFWVLLKLQNGI